MKNQQNRQLPDKFVDIVAAMPEYRYGVNRIIVTLDDGTRVWDVFVAGEGEIVKVGANREIPFDPSRVVGVKSQ